MERRLVLHGAAAAACATAAAPGRAQAVEEHMVNGFRRAKFGMKVAEVQAAIARDFPSATGVERIDNPAEKTTVLVLGVPVLEPGPGAARINYVFGAASARLMHISVVWQSGPAADTAERARYAVAGSQLAAYMRAQPWGPKVSASPTPAGPNGLVLFAGVDSRGAGADVRVLGLATVAPNGQDGSAPSGPAQLRVAYYANVAQPDIRMTAAL